GAGEDEQRAAHMIDDGLLRRVELWHGDGWQGCPDQPVRRISGHGAPSLDEPSPRPSAEERATAITSRATDEISSPTRLSANNRDGRPLAPSPPQPRQRGAGNGARTSVRVHLSAGLRRAEAGACL